jgi:molybdopterin/thiamine biosynthesis adenylyltransferase
VRLPRHQAPDGNLCVFPREAHYWSPFLLAADVAADAIPELFRLVRAGGDELRQAEDPQGEPLITYYGGNSLGGVIVDERALGAGLEQAGSGMIEYRFTSAGLDWLRGPPRDSSEPWPANGACIIASLTDRAGKHLIESPSPALAAQFGGQLLEGRWTFLEQPPRTTDPDELWAVAAAEDPSVERWTPTANGWRILGIATRDELLHGIHDISWTFLARHVSPGRPGRRARSGNPAVRNTKAHKFGPAVSIRGLRRTEEDLGARIPHLGPLREATVGVIGLGSIGAPIVQELVKARTGSLRLWDHDFIDPNTAVRYPLGLGAAGVDKGVALARWAAEHDPGVSVALNSAYIGRAPLEPEGPGEGDSLSNFVSGLDLLICATAEHDVNRWLDHAARKLSVPRLFVWSQSGYGGIVAQLDANRTGCFHCLSLLISDRSIEGQHLVPVPPAAAGIPSGTFQARGCADKTFTASHPDLLPLSIHSARLAQDLLGSSTRPRFRGDVFAVQVREADETPIPPRWTTYDLPPDPRCPNCNKD